MKKTLIKLIARFIGHKGITFDGGRVYYWKVPMIVLPMDILAFLQHNLEKEFGPDTRKILYSLGKIQGKNGTNILIERFKIIPDAKDLSFFMEQTEFIGVGKIKMINNDFANCHMEIGNNNSPNARAYVNLFGKREKPICDYARGMFAGAFQAIFNASARKKEDFEGIEVECIAKGNPSCRIEIKRVSEWDASDPGIKDELPAIFPEIDEARKKETLAMLLKPPLESMINPETELSRTIKRYHGEYHLKFMEGGIVTIFGMDSLITPMDIFMLLYYVLSKRYGANAKKIFYDAGSFLAKKSTELIFNELGLRKGQVQNINIAFEQPGLFGLGTVHIVKKDTKNHDYIFKVDKAPGVHYSKLIGLKKEKADDYLAGFFNGVLEYLFDLKFSTIEEKCVVSGSPVCLFRSTGK